ncbi:hypothetical protein BDY19DRAFT_989745 [Irpex rosettiformis]|uniref:Uncharacterized protein n=1 Tax=Irpex rosettiformis TaxID=378272 RepID=A0ACB8UF72_9APHY|nr:hypothetical protein BDY19DRAFT_989745 [Irpex rosettiformis]
MLAVAQACRLYPDVPLSNILEANPMQKFLRSFYDASAAMSRGRRHGLGCTIEWLDLEDKELNLSIFEDASRIGVLKCKIGATLDPRMEIHRSQEADEDVGGDSASASNSGSRSVRDEWATDREDDTQDDADGQAWSIIKLITIQPAGDVYEALDEVLPALSATLWVREQEEKRKQRCQADTAA